MCTRILALSGKSALVREVATATMFAAMTACNDYTHGLDSAAKIQCPTLLVLGDRDAMTPSRAAKALAEAIPNSQTVVPKGCLERPFRGATTES